MSILPSRAGLDEDLLRTAPDDLSVELTSELEHDMVEVVYSFLLEGAEIEPLLVEVSRCYPRLCFILGTVVAASGESESRFVNNGRERLWRLSESLREKIVAPVLEVMKRLEAMDSPTEEDEDGDLWASIQADWDMMDAVVEHWDSAAKKQRARIAVDMAAEWAVEPGHQPRHPSRRG